MRQLVQEFYRHLREDSPEGLDSVLSEGLSLEQVQAFAEGDLHEYALKHGAFKSVAWLASKQIVPGNWNALADMGARALLNKGFKHLSTSEKSGIPKEVVTLVEAAFRHAGGKEEVFSRLFKNRKSVQASSDTKNEKNTLVSTSSTLTLDSVLSSPELVLAAVSALRALSRNHIKETQK